MKNIALKHSGTTVHSIKELWGRYGKKEFASPLRSTVPNLAFWMDPEKRISELCSWLDWKVPAECEIDYEYLVRPLEGHGTPSHTDTMITWPDSALAVEAKFTEPKYETVGKWLSKHSTQNAKDILHGWVSAISSVTGKTPNDQTVRNMTYQALHRVASVCAKPAKQRAVVYLVFRQEKSLGEYYSQMLTRIAEGFDTIGCLALGVLSVRLAPSEHYQALIEEWKQTRQYDQERLMAILFKKEAMQLSDEALALYSTCRS